MPVEKEMTPLGLSFKVPAFFADWELAENGFSLHTIKPY